MALVTQSACETAPKRLVIDVLKSIVRLKSCLQFADLLALAGDSADNIPGVRGIGPKRAQALVRSHQDLEGVLTNAHAEKAKVGSCHIFPAAFVCLRAEMFGGIFFPAVCRIVCSKYICTHHS